MDDVSKRLYFIFLIKYGSVLLMIAVFGYVFPFEEVLVNDRILVFALGVFSPLLFSVLFVLFLYQYLFCINVYSGWYDKEKKMIKITRMGIQSYENVKRTKDPNSVRIFMKDGKFIPVIGLPKEVVDDLCS